MAFEDPQDLLNPCNLPITMKSRKTMKYTVADKMAQKILSSMFSPREKPKIRSEEDFDLFFSIITDVLSKVVDFAENDKKELVPLFPNDFFDILIDIVIEISTLDDDAGIIDILSDSEGEGEEDLDIEVLEPLNYDVCKNALNPFQAENEFCIQWDKIPHSAKFRFVNHIVPEELIRVFENKLKPFDGMTARETAALTAIKKIQASGLTMTNYRNYLAITMFAQLYEQEKQVAEWTMNEAEMHCHVNGFPYHKIPMPGIFDKSPDVRKGDSIIVTLYGVSHEASVLKVVDEDAFLEFKDEQSKRMFGFVEKVVSCSVDFILNDYVFDLISKVLRSFDDRCLLNVFPRPKPDVSLTRDIHLTEQDLFNPVIADNKEQFQAVRSIVRGTSGRYCPYVLFGPPGTGKTVTVVESIQQVWKNIPKSKILVAAPSNGATDLLASKLLEHVPPSKIIRLNAKSREDSVADPKLEAISVTLDQGTRIPEETRIICATLVTTGSRHLKTSRTFTHVFVDEAGQALEPEILIPLHSRLSSTGRWILSGDPRQLGPVVQSRVAKDLGLERSLLQRIIDDNEAYKDVEGSGNLDSRFITRLVDNFRSHVKILELPSLLFYDNSLNARLTNNDLMQTIEWLKSDKCPIMFHGIRGKHLKCGRGSKSLYNMEEVGLVLEYVGKLVQSGVVALSEIGITTPYRSQVRVLREEIEKRYSTRNGLLIGSTEQFQGQERRVMIVSTVRSSFKGEEAVFTRQLGFLSNPQRFNVAVTRAQSLLVVIGDPHLLKRDRWWGEFLEFAIAHRAYVGCSFKSRNKKNKRKKRRY